MQLSDLIVDIKEAWVDYPGLDGFKVKVANLARTELSALRKRCVSTKFDKKTHQAQEVVDEEKFIKEFTKATIRDWKGFKYKYLENFILVDLSKIENLNEELPYSSENALILIKGSTDFDTWINDTVFDLDNFRTATERGNVAETGSVD